MRERLADPSPVVRIEAASALAARGETKESLPVLGDALKGDNPEVALHAARAIELLGLKARPLLPTIEQVADRATKAKGGDIMMFIRFALEAWREQATGSQ